ncbi:TetR/AcrR family transcriptional regulator [Sphaerisporangium aureirubrum]|uniref:TetR family transcriptional regulator C-terminal domain-containing protein n=1 Tax=Sphaerisporangium aureirubrum TaxID=1544736 RepID=A0ABW1NPB1_9ACTN
MARVSMREEIVEAALEQFHTRGYNAAGVKDITVAAGVPKGSFYNHFDSKESLAVVALERYGANVRLGDLADRSVAPLPRLRAHFELLRDETVRRGYTRGCMFGNFGAEVADHSGPVRGAVHDAFARWSAAIAATLAEARQAGALPSGLDPEQVAAFLLSAWEGTLLRARADRSSEAFDTFFTVAFGTLLA